MTAGPEQIDRPPRPQDELEGLLRLLAEHRALTAKIDTLDRGDPERERLWDDEEALARQIRNYP